MKKKQKKQQKKLEFLFSHQISLATVYYYKYLTCILEMKHKMKFSQISKQSARNI